MSDNQEDQGDSEQDREELLAMLAHELRTPLGTISNAIQVLRLTGDGEGEQQKTWRRAIETAEREVHHEALLVDDLLEAFEVLTETDDGTDCSALGIGLAAKKLIEKRGDDVLAGSGDGEAGEHAAVTRKILVVEDNPDAAATMRDFLELSGHEVELAISGTDGVEAARHFHPEIVLCDLGLPGMDGYQVAEALRSDPDTASVRLIAVTGYGRDEDRRRSREAGFDIHLTKPVDPVQLRRLLQ